MKRVYNLSQFYDYNAFIEYFRVNYVQNNNQIRSIGVYEDFGQFAFNSVLPYICHIGINGCTVFIDSTVQRGQAAVYSVR